MAVDIVIDEEIRDIIPPSSAAEREQLERNLIEDGCRDVLILWANHDILLDGHTRFDICTEHAIPYKTKSLRFDTREEAISWVVHNQLGRRNLTREQLAYLRGKRYNLEKQPHGDSERTANSPSVQNAHLEKTAEKIAEETGVNESTVRRDGDFAEALDSVPKEVKDAVLSGEVKSTKAAVEQLAELPKVKQKAAAKAIASGEADSVQKAVDSVTDEPAPPKFEHPAFESKTEFRSMVLTCTNLLKQIEDLLPTNAGTLLKKDWHQIKAYIENARNAIKFAMPEAVCAKCAGQGKYRGEPCQPCRGAGWVNRASAKLANKGTG